MEGDLGILIFAECTIHVHSLHQGRHNLLVFSEILHPTIHQRTNNRQIVGKLFQFVLSFFIDEESRFLPTILQTFEADWLDMDGLYVPFLLWGIL